MSWRASSGVPATRSTTARAVPRTSRDRARSRRASAHDCTSPTARAPATRCGRPRSEEPCCPGRTCSTTGRCPRSRGRSCCGRARASCPTAAGAAGTRSSRRSSGATSSCVAALRDGAGGALVRARPLRPAPAPRRARTRARRRLEPELIVVGSFPGRPSFAGLGELTASELETLWPSRQRAAPAVLAAATAAWDAVRAPEPTALAGWATRETEQLPFLAPALRRLLEELPAPVDGLSRTERRALEAVAAGARTPPARSSRRSASRTRRSSATPGSTARSRRSDRERRGSSRRDDGTPLPPPPPLSDSRTSPDSGCV